MDRRLRVNGFEVKASYAEKNVQERFLPLLKEWTAKARELLPGRLVVFLSAPPGAGKSTLAAFLEVLSKEIAGLLPVQALGMDGFHYHQAEIERRQVLRDGVWVPMKKVKGGPESFDVDKLEGALKRLRAGEPLRWPIYDRNLHDVQEDALEVTAPIALVEGNWLLYGGDPWPRLHPLCHDSLALTAGEELLKERLVSRKMKGGLTREEAETFYQGSDGPNVRAWAAFSRKANRTWPLPL